MDVCVVHLVWAPLGPERLRRFVESYDARSAGAKHRLLIVYNGFEVGEDLDAWERELDGVAHEVLFLDEPVLDLEAYWQAAERVPADSYCFLNSYSEVLADGWLGLLVDALAESGVGIAAASGSWASQSSHLRFGLRLGGPYAGLLGDPADNARAFRALASAGERRKERFGPTRAAIEIPRTLLCFPPFPAHHVRTNGFLMRREMWSSLRRRRVRSKSYAHLLESGRSSFTRQIEARGMRVCVVGRDGALYEHERWPHSATFWQRDQENLLIADNQTSIYSEADPELRAMLARYAWGAAAESGR